MHGHYFLKKLKVHPNVVTIFSIILGIGAGVMFYYPDMKHTLLGILLLMWANHYDSADGQLARLTGQKTQWGRMLDGFAGDIWFFTIYAAICLRLMNQPCRFILVTACIGVFLFGYWLLFRVLFVIANNVHWRIIIVIFIYTF